MEQGGQAAARASPLPCFYFVIIIHVAIERFECHMAPTTNTFVATRTRLHQIT